MKLLILTIGLLVLAVVMMAVRVLFVKGGKFPSLHTDSEALRKRGVGCAHRDQ